MEKIRELPEVWVTVGPKMRVETIQAMINAGVNGLRILFAALQPPEATIEKARRVRAIIDKSSSRCLLAADLSGEKIRLGKFGNLLKFPVKKGDHINLTQSTTFNLRAKTVPVLSKDFIQRISIGDQLIIGHANVVLKVLKKRDDELYCEVTEEGEIEVNRGIAAMSKSFIPTGMSKGDWKSLRLILKTDVFDMLNISFTSSASDISAVKEEIRKSKKKLPIASKIETLQGVDNIKEIIKVSDRIIVASGLYRIFLLSLGN